MEETRKGMAIASLILGILSCTICCCIGGVLGIVGLILGIVSVSKGLGGKGMAIGGIVTSGIGILVGVAMIALVMRPDFQEGFWEGFEEGYEAGYNGDFHFEDDAPDISGTFTADDGSTIYFYEDGTFDWYRDEENSDDLKSGNYSAVFGDDAEEMLTTDLSEYGITQQELDDYHDRNEDVDLYKQENLVVLTLETTDIELDDSEVDMPDLPYTVYYYGHCDGDSFDGVNMSTASYFILTRQK